MDKTALNGLLEKFVDGTMSGKEFESIRTLYVHTGKRKAQNALNSNFCTMDDVENAFSDSLIYLQKSAARAVPVSEPYNLVTTFELKFFNNIREIFRRSDNAVIFARIKKHLEDSGSFLPVGIIPGDYVQWGFQQWARVTQSGTPPQATDQQIDILQETMMTFAEMGLEITEAKEGARRRSALVTNEQLLVYMESIFDVAQHDFGCALSFTANDLNRIISDKLWMNVSYDYLDETSDSDEQTVSISDTVKDEGILGSEAEFRCECLFIEECLAKSIAVAREEIETGSKRPITALKLWLLYIQARDTYTESLKPYQKKSMLFKISGTTIVEELAQYPVLPQYKHTQLDSHISNLGPFLIQLFGEELYPIMRQPVTSHVILDVLDRFFEPLRKVGGPTEQNERLEHL